MKVTQGGGLKRSRATRPFPHSLPPVCKASSSVCRSVFVFPRRCERVPLLVSAAARRPLTRQRENTRGASADPGDPAHGEGECVIGSGAPAILRAALTQPRPRMTLRDRLLRGIGGWNVVFRKMLAEMSCASVYQCVPAR